MKKSFLSNLIQIQLNRDAYIVTQSLYETKWPGDQSFNNVYLIDSAD